MHVLQYFIESNRPPCRADAKTPQVPTQTSEDLEHSVTKKRLSVYISCRIDLGDQDKSDLRSESGPEVTMKLHYDNAFAKITDLLSPI